MKIRIKGNTLRFRLTKSEVILLAETGYIEEKTQFESSTLKYVVTGTDASTMSVDFIDGNITLLVPQNLLQQWAHDNTVSHDQNMQVNNNGQLYILLEKDFKCIDASPVEDQSDYFENPAKSC